MRAVVWIIRIIVVGLALLFMGIIPMPNSGVEIVDSAYGADGPDYQEMANEAVRALNGSRVWVTTTPDTIGDYYCERRLISLGTKGNVKWLLAHEIGHHLLGHCGEHFQAEVEANAMAIRVLQVWGMTEEAAYRMTANHLLGLQNFRKNNPRPGHDYCGELQVLMTQFAGQYPPRDPAKVRETCPLVLPAGALEPTVRLAQWAPACQPQTYTEIIMVGGRTIVCVVFVDCGGNITRTCS